MKPSITELLNLLNKPALINWANKQGLQGVDIGKQSKIWLKEGNSIHSQINKFISNGVPFENKIDEENFVMFSQNKEFLSSEKSIETEWFVGRYDLKMKWNDKVYLVDFKRNHQAIYLENRLQLVAYSMAEQCDSFAIVSVPEFKVLNFKIENRKPYEDMLKSLSLIYSLKNQIENV